MDEATRRAAEQLAEQFADLPLTTVARVVTACGAADPWADPADVERRSQAVLAGRADSITR